MNVAKKLIATLCILAFGLAVAMSCPMGISQASASASYKAHAYSYKKYPLYYKVRGTADTSDKVKKGKVMTSQWDSLGRSGKVVAKVTYSMVEQSAGWRESFDDECSTISGWGNQKKVKVKLSNGKKYKGYAWNRSHLLADCLGGHAVKENLICGTRTQNVGNNDYDNPGGMQYAEKLALEYLYDHKNGWVYYKVTPIYKGKELVARSVYVDVKSNDGSINQHIEVFNALNGHKINYKTGKVTAKKTASSVVKKLKYVYITKTGKKYHRKGCRYLYSKTRISLSKAKARGYKPCAVCM